VIIVRTVIWVSHGTRLEETRNLYGILFGKPEERDDLEELGVDGRVILEWVLNKYSGRL
jgi:hypothetical protein